MPAPVGEDALTLYVSGLDRSKKGGREIRPMMMVVHKTENHVCIICVEESEHAEPTMIAFVVAVMLVPAEHELHSRR